MSAVPPACVLVPGSAEVLSFGKVRFEEDGRGCGVAREARVDGSVVGPDVGIEGLQGCERESGV